MIAFATLILGLALGVRPVEIVVAGDTGPGGQETIAAIHVLLDGETIAELHQAPWIAECDLGTELAPHHLEAIALDSEGNELHRIEQWLNLPHESAMVSAVLEPAPGEDGGSLVARVSWESSVGAEPKKVKAILDGAPIPVADPHRIPLPRVDPSQFHLLSVELEFEDRVVAGVDLTFGGFYADEVSTEMTALPIMPATGRRASRDLKVESVAGWFTKNGKELRVVAVEKAKMEIIFVLDRPFASFFLPDERPKIPKSLKLTDEHRIRFAASAPSQSQGVASTFELFPISRALDVERAGNLYRLLTQTIRPPENSAAQPAAAVAVAGLAAFESRHRRAVVLVPSEESSQEPLTPAQVRRYLERLRVPFYVWEPESKPSGRFSAWGELRSTGNLKQLTAAFEELQQDLAPQWIVWIDGKHLPQDIELSAAADGFSFPR